MKVLKLFITLLAIMLISSCMPANQNEFAIYLLKNKTLIENPISTPNSVELEDKPIISTLDIISYSKETHEITLTAEAFERVQNLEVTVRGRPFAVCVGRETIYTGAFWTPISSIGFRGIIIMKPLTNSDKIQLEPGYPSESFFQGVDPRDDPRIFEALRRSGKLE